MFGRNYNSKYLIKTNTADDSVRCFLRFGTVKAKNLIPTLIIKAGKAP